MAKNKKKESAILDSSTNPSGHGVSIQKQKIADVTEVIERISDAFVALDTNWC